MTLVRASEAHAISNVLPPVYIVALREVRAKMTAAALLAAKRRSGNQKPDGDQTVEAAQLAVTRRGLARPAHGSAPLVESCHGCQQRCARAQQTGVAPDEIADVRRIR